MLNEAQRLRLLWACSRPLLDPDGQPLAWIDVEKEKERLKGAFKGAKVPMYAYFLMNGTTGVIADTLRSKPDEGEEVKGFDVVSLALHGWPASHDWPGGRLLFENEFGEVIPLTAEVFENLFPALGGCHRRPKLVVLLCCYSEEAGKKLVDAGIPEVIAIERCTEVLDNAAIAYAGRFYRCLADGRSVQYAHEEGQRAVTTYGYTQEEQWWLHRQGITAEQYAESFKLLTDGNTRLVNEGVLGTYREYEPEVNHNVPRREAKEVFLGREQETIEINRQLNNSQVVTIPGSLGIGKTPLVQEIAWWHIDRRRFENVIWYPVGEEGSRKGLVNTLKRVLSVDEDEQAVLDHLGNSSTLLVLDDFEPNSSRRQRELIQYIKDISNCVHVIITSQQRFNEAGWAVVGLQGLGWPVSGKLFISFAYDVPISKIWYEDIATIYQYYNVSSSDVEEICNLLDGNPYNIKQMAILRNELDLSLLQVVGFIGEVPTKDPFQGLSTSARKLCHVLAMFVGGASPDAIKQLYGKDLQHPGSTELGELKRHYLLKSEGEGREVHWSLNPAVRAIALKKMKEEDVKRLRQRFAEYYINYAVDHQNEEDLLNREQVNINAAIEWCHKHPKWR